MSGFMSNVRRVFANMSWMMISQILTSVLAFFWTILTTRYLGVVDNGIFGNAVSFANLLVVIADLGMTTYITRAISTDSNLEKSYIGNALTIKLLLSFVYLAVTLIIVNLFGWNNKIGFVIFLFAFESVIKSFCNLFYASFQAHEKIKYQAISNIILNVLTFVFIVIVTFTSFGLFGIAVAYIIANILALIYSYLAIRRYFIVPKLLFDKDLSKKLIIAGIPFALTSLFYTVYYSIDMVMLTKFIGAYPTGLYNASYKLINVLTLFYTIYSAVVFPVMSKLFKNDRDMLTLSFNKSVKYLSLVTIPLAIATLFYAGDVIHICYGNAFAEADNVLKILIWTVCFLFINGAASLVLNASHKEFSVTKIYSIAAVFNVILNFILIPNYSVYGASIATVLSEVLILILELYMLSKINQLPNRHLIFDLVKIIMASIIMGFVLNILDLSVWLAIPIGIIVYLVVIIAIRTTDEDDKAILRQLLNR